MDSKNIVIYSTVDCASINSNYNYITNNMKSYQILFNK